MWNVCELHQWIQCLGKWNVIQWNCSCYFQPRAVNTPDFPHHVHLLVHCHEFTGCHSQSGESSPAQSDCGAHHRGQRSEWWHTDVTLWRWNQRRWVNRVVTGWSAGLTPPAVTDRCGRGHTLAHTFRGPLDSWFLWWPGPGLPASWREPGAQRHWWPSRRRVHLPPAAPAGTQHVPVQGPSGSGSTEPRTPQTWAQKPVQPEAGAAVPGTGWNLRRPVCRIRGSSRNSDVRRGLQLRRRKQDACSQASSQIWVWTVNPLTWTVLLQIHSL